MGRLGSWLIVALTAGLLIIPGAAQARPLNKQKQQEIYQFAASNSLFVLYHEVAHLLFHQLDLPVLGREEDAADNLATWTLLNQKNARNDRVLADAARGWLLSGEVYGSGEYEDDFAAGHSLDKQRAYQIVCMMVGKDKTAFRPIANEYRMERDRQESCFWDYETVDRSLSSLLKSRNPKKGGGTEVTVTYHHVSGKLRSAANAFRDSGVFDQVAGELRKNYSLPSPVAFNAKRCGEANAFYDPETIEIIFCYELMQDYMDLYRSAAPSSGKQKFLRP